MNRFVRVALLALPLVATVTFGCARSKRQPTVVGPKPAEKPGPASPAEGQPGSQQQYSGAGGDANADKGASVPTDTDTSSPSSTPSPSSPSNGGGGLGTGGSNAGSGGFGNNGNTNNGNTNNGGFGNNGNTNNGGFGNNGNTNNGTTNTPTEAEIQAHVRRVNTWDASSDRLPTGVRWLVIDLDR